MSLVEGCYLVERSNSKIKYKKHLRIRKNFEVFFSIREKSYKSKNSLRKYGMVKWPCSWKNAWQSRLIVLLWIQQEQNHVTRCICTNGGINYADRYGNDFKTGEERRIWSCRSERMEFKYGKEYFRSSKRTKSSDHHWWCGNSSDRRSIRCRSFLWKEISRSNSSIKRKN